MKYLNHFCGFYSIFVFENSRFRRKIGGLPDFDFCRLASLHFSLSYFYLQRSRVFPYHVSLETQKGSKCVTSIHSVGPG